MIAGMDSPTHSRADHYLAWASAVGRPAVPEHHGVKGAIARVVPPHRRPSVRLAATHALRPVARRRAKRLADRSDLRLHIGCGTLYKDGWVNIDLAGTRVDLPWDLAEPMPFAAGSVGAIFHEHLLEHLTYQQGIELHRKCLSLLRPGGILRIGVPDAGAALQAYAMASPGEAGQWPTALARVAALTYDSGHRSIYDAETLELSCTAAGFGNVASCSFGEGQLAPNADSPNRRGYTLYVEATA